MISIYFLCAAAFFLILFVFLLYLDYLNYEMKIQKLAGPKKEEEKKEDANPNP